MRSAGSLVIAFFCTAVLVAASTFGVAYGRNTAQGQIVTAHSWRFERSFLIGSCRNGYLPPRRCAVIGHIDFVLTAVLQGDNMSLTQTFTSRNGVRFTIEPVVVCRIERVFDTDCAGNPDPVYKDEFGTHMELRTTFHDAEVDVRKFVNLIYRVQVDGAGTVRGSAKTNDNVFLGTTQRWSCRPDPPAGVECRFG